MGVRNVKNLNIDSKDFNNLFKYIKYLNKFDLMENVETKSDDNITEQAVMKKLE